ncbi:MAG: hypothetical protein GX657_04430 [Chloroflexi bacterium]|jgi:hypothetical protein|nr:hypothetical protein [Chloroflexota bacterium]
MQRELTVGPPTRAASWASRPTLGRPANHLSVLLLYLVLTVVLTYPLVTHVATAVPGPPDANGAWLYDLWKTRQGLAGIVQGGHLPAPRQYADGPSLGVANHLLALPVLLLGNEVLAYNALLFLSFVLTAYGTYLLVMYITGNPYAAAVSGCILAFAPLRLHWLATGQLPLLATQWIPLTFLSLERALREQRRRHGLLAGLFLGLAMLSSWSYVLLAGGATLLYAFVRVWPWRARSNRAARRALFPGALLAAALAVAALLLGGPSEGAVLPAAAAVAPSPGIDDLLLPSAYHPLWGQSFAGLRSATPLLPDGVPGFAYLGLITVLLALMALTEADNEEPRTPSGMVWITVVFGLLALGPVLKAFGAAVSLDSFPELGERLARSLAALGVPSPAGGALPLPAVVLYLVASPSVAADVLRAAPIVPTFALAVMAGIGAATMIGTSRASGTRRSPWEEQRNPLYAAMRPRRRWDVGALLGAAMLITLVAVDYGAVPLACGFTEPHAQALDEWLADQARDGAVLYYPLERTSSGFTLYASRLHAHPPAQAALAAAPDALLRSFPSAEAVAMLRSRGVAYIVVAAQAPLPGRALGTDVTATISAATDLVPAGIVHQGPAWNGPTDDFAAWLPSWLPSKPERLIVYSLD